MGQQHYKWDIEALQQKLAVLQRGCGYLEQNRDFLAALENEVKRNWQSAAGNIYEGNIKIDLENYDDILRELKEKIETLDRIIRQAYQDCEESVSQMLRGVCGRIPVL